VEGKVHRICLWAGPRNVATTLLYSFRQRPDTRVLDEPLYAHYLLASGDAHPGREEILAAMEQDGARAVQNAVLGPCDRPVLFVKDLAQHLAGIDHTFLRQTVNVLLIADPRRTLCSLLHQIPRPASRDLSVAPQVELLRHLREIGQDPPILDARELLHDPEGVLWTLCERLDLSFTSRMLQWPSGPKPEEGAWAKHWYGDVQRSTGFLPWRERKATLPARFEPLVAECRPDYESLYAQAIKARR
jgi:hypothetical protein